MEDKPKLRKGFASMSPEKRSQIARMGGKASGGNFANNRERARLMGKKGGQSKRRDNSNESN